MGKGRRRTFSMWTSNTFFSATRQVPSQAVQRSAAGVLYPVAEHWRQGCWICCIMPGPSGRSIVCRYPPAQASEE